MGQPASSVPLISTEYRQSEMLLRARQFADEMQRRRTVRDFDSRAVPRDIIENCIRAAASAPSGANHQHSFETISAFV